MISFAFTTLFLLSLGTVLYLIVRALPRVAEEPAEVERKSILDRWAHSEIPEKIDAALNGFLFKFLRKTRVTVLKLDNALGNQIQKIKPEENGTKPSIREMAAVKEEEIKI